MTSTSLSAMWKTKKEGSNQIQGGRDGRKEENNTEESEKGYPQSGQKKSRQKESGQKKSSQKKSREKSHPQTGQEKSGQETGQEALRGQDRYGQEVQTLCHREIEILCGPQVAGGSRHRCF
ncbi:hypothetical protein ACFLQW_03920 [Candidatus Zixiibacteriota bacterium]